jgi:uncharacterized membrane protein
MDDITIARLFHVLAVVMWIGGVAFVTTVIFPSIRRNHPPAERLAAFHRIEQHFARQAAIWVIVAGASGFWMVYRADMWDRFGDAHYWWMYAMVGLWLIFFAMLFIIEPLFLHRHMAASAEPERDFDRMERMHRLLLAFAVVAILGAVAGSHGLI